MGVVEDNHPLVADHSDAANLDRIEPAHVHAGKDLVRVVESQEDDVLSPRLQIRLAARDQIDRIGAEPVAEHRKVMRCEVPQGVDVLSNRAQPGALEVEVPDLAQAALVDVALDGSHRGVEEECVTDHERPSGLLRDGHHRLRIGHGGRQWLLHQDMDPGAQTVFGDFAVSRGRCRDDDRVNIPIAQQSPVVGVRAGGRVLPFEGRKPAGRRLGARGEPGTTERAGEDASVVRSPEAESDERYTKQIWCWHGVGK